MTTLSASPRYAKFFRMLRVGLPEGAVRQLLRAQGLDERALALGPDALERDLSTPLPPPTGPAVDTRVYETSLRMLLVGVPQGAVENALRVRMLDARAYEQTLGKLRATLARTHHPLIAQSTSLSETTDRANKTESTATQDGVAAVMVRVGVPEGAVQQRLDRLEQQRHREQASSWTNLFLTAATEDPHDATPLEQHAPLRRFFAMLRAGVAAGAVENALVAAGLPRELAHWDPALPVGTLVARATP